MTKQEFESYLNYGKRQEDVKSVTPLEYQLIEKIYTFHPSISEIRGKWQVARLYEEFGIGIFKDMMPTAERAKELEEEIRAVKRRLSDLIDKYEDLKKGVI